MSKMGEIYLEEDCDLSTLVTALALKGEPVQYKKKHTDKYSPIRSYNRYLA